MPGQRLFIAVWPPATVVERVRALPRPAVAGLRWTAEAQWHVTLRFLGWVDDDDRPALDDAWSAIPLDGPASGVVASIGPAVDRFGHRVLHVPVHGLERLAEAVTSATAHVGAPPEPRPFHGHLTLARVAKRGRVDLRPLVGGGIEGEWAVDAVTLVASTPSRDGAHYDMVAARSLSRAPAP